MRLATSGEPIINPAVHVSLLLYYQQGLFVNTVVGKSLSGRKNSKTMQKTTITELCDTRSEHIYISAPQNPGFSRSVIKNRGPYVLLNGYYQILLILPDGDDLSGAL